MNIIKQKNKVSNLNRIVRIYGKDYNLKISYKNIKIIELNNSYNSIIIYMPNKYKKMNKENILNLAIDKMYYEIAKEEIEQVMEKTRIMLGYAPEDYEIKDIKNGLAKCTKDKNIIVNPNIVKYNKETIENIILREYCKLKYRPNSKSFIEMVKRYIPNYENYTYMVSGVNY